MDEQLSGRTAPGPRAAGCAAAGRPPSRPRSTDPGGRGAGPPRTPEPGRRVLPAAAHRARRRPGPHPGRGAGDHPEPRQDAQPGHRLGRDADRRRGRGRTRSHPLGLAPGMRIATLVSLTLTPLHIEDDLRRWDGRGEQVPAEGHAILFARSIAAELPADLPRRAEPGRHGRLRRPGPDPPRGRRPYGAGRGRDRRRRQERVTGPGRRAPRRSRADHRRRPRPGRGRACCGPRGWPTRSSSPTPATRSPWPPRSASRGADVTVVCVDVPGCEHGAILATAPGGTVVFFSMATSFPRRRAGRRGPGRRRDHADRKRVRPRSRASSRWTCLRTEPGVHEDLRRTCGDRA